jgi:hypothetical protein
MAELSPSVPSRELVPWIQRLLEDRRQRVAPEQRLAPHIHHLRRRLKQAAEYLDKLAAGAHEAGRLRGRLFCHAKQKKGAWPQRATPTLR